MILVVTEKNDAAQLDCSPSVQIEDKPEMGIQHSCLSFLDVAEKTMSLWSSWSYSATSFPLALKFDRKRAGMGTAEGTFRRC